MLPVHTLFTMEGGDSEFANFTLPTLKIFLEARSQNVSGDTQWLLAHAVGCPKTHFFSHELSIFWSAKKRRKDTFSPHPPSPSPVIFASATVVAFVLLRNSRSNFHRYTQREATPTPKSARKWCCDRDPAWLLVQKMTKGIHSCKPASQNRPIAIVGSMLNRTLHRFSLDHANILPSTGQEDNMAQPKNRKEIELSISLFGHFSPFNCCFSVVL